MAESDSKADKKKARNAAYYAANREKAKVKEAARIAANPEKARARRAAWRAANPADPEKERARHASYRAANKEKIKIGKAAYCAANPGAARIRNQNRKARQRKNGGVLSEGLAAKLFKLQRGRCACCKEPLGDNFHMDHILPIALGGMNVDANIQLLRQICNNKKHAKHPIDYMQSKGFLL